MATSVMSTTTRGRSLALWTLVILALSALVLGGCRGSVKRDAPIHLNWNMDQQQRTSALEGLKKRDVDVLVVTGDACVL